ncbi:hypothetical protein PIB30_062055 [Stylosanthes scabra]|uniref:Protein kinase domain-containing protein n=1 Tax=Stylosanthes scabra TaxID=79078 RepID=A0ABU6SMU7_9FABA|nr:hypothetical protein [Stylosanthes scabra]
MWREVGICIVLVLHLHQSLAAGQRQRCVSSSCGKISNISHPFRLKDDPSNCGNSKYELECVNDVALLRLTEEAEYKVEAINYNNYTIRLVDPNIEDDNCSSLPRYFLYRFNFTDAPDSQYVSSQHWYGVDDTYRATQLQVPTSEQAMPLFQHIIYVNCITTVRDMDNNASSSSSCLDPNTYVVAGDLAATGGIWKPGCWINKIAATSGLFRFQKQHPYYGWRFRYETEEDVYDPTTYSDVHSALAYGFELSWLHAICHEHQCGPGACYFNHSTQNVLCYSLCSYPYGGARHCGMYSLIRLRSPKDIYETVLIHTKTAITGWYVLLSYLSTRVLFGVALLVVLFIYKWRRRNLSTYVNIENFLQDNHLAPIRYSYKEIKSMTKNFKVKLGQGGFGSAYKGKLRSGPHVAIKMLKLKQSKANNGQDFINEVATIGRIHHVNVVRLIGFCVEGSKRALIYDFMPNSSLDKYVFSKEESFLLSYEKMYEISLGVARGISYLHRGCAMQILHFDIKPHNILLDENFVPKISDFGLAKLYPIDHSIVTLTYKRGTIGYIAPELFYNNLGGVSYKADVYSFGMLLMEVAGRRKNLNPHAENTSQVFFPTWVYEQVISKGKEVELENGTEAEKSIAKKLIITALWCIQLKPSDRPSMNDVVGMLEGEVCNLTMPPKPLLYPTETAPGMDDNFNSEQIRRGDSANATGDFGETIPSNATLENSLSGRN